MTSLIPLAEPFLRHSVDVSGIITVEKSEKDPLNSYIYRKAEMDHLMYFLRKCNKAALLPNRLGYKTVRDFENEGYEKVHQDIKKPFMR